MKRQQIALFSRLRLLFSISTDEELARELNRRSPGGAFSRESIRRWSNGSQSIRKNTRHKLAKALKCSPEQFDSYLNGATELSELLKSVSLHNPVNESDALQSTILEAASKMSLPVLAQTISKLIELCSERWSLFQAFRPKSKNLTIAQLVQENLEGCIAVLEGVSSPERCQAIANGQKPTVEELELLEVVLPVEWDELEKMYQQGYANGHADAGCENAC